jgi:hypothetical protein
MDSTNRFSAKPRAVHPFALAPLCVVFAACSAHGDASQPGDAGDLGTQSDGGTSRGDGGAGGFRGFFIDNGPKNEGGGAVTIDSQGGVHILHTGGGGGAVRYGHCASGCDQSGGWTFTDVPGATASSDATTQEVNATLAVDGQGKPRILTATGAMAATYSECGDGCSDPSAQWMSISVPTTMPLGNPSGYIGAGRHFFAVPAAGGAAFAYSDGARGLVYVACASSCTNSSNWHETVIVPLTAGGRFINIALAFDAQSHPSVAYYYSPGATSFDRGGLGFAACSGTFTSTSNWTHVTFETTVTMAEFILALDGQGRPRIYANVTQPGSNMNVGQFVWCDANCMSSPQSWEGPAVWPMEDSMVLDAAGNPRVVGQTTGGVTYRHCTTGCTTTSPTWQDTVFPDTDMGYLTTSSRLFGRRALAVDAAGNAVILDDAVTGTDISGVFLRTVGASQ